MGIDFRFYLNRQGIQGKRGERGEQGFSPLISVKTQTANEYVLTVQNEDGSFDTPNLRGNAIANNGGTYIRYNPLTEEMYTGNADYATNEQAGVVLLASYDQLIAGGSENLIPTSQDVYNFVSQQIISGFVTQQEFDTYTAATAITLNNLSTQKLSFVDLSNAIVAGNNITLSVDSENNTITINAAGGDLSNYVTLDTAQTITQSKTFDSNGELHFTMVSDGIYFEDAHAPSSERIRIFGRLHSAGTSYYDLTLKSYMDIQFELSGNGGTTRLSEIKSAMTLANSAVQPEDMTTYLADYVDLTTNQSITGTKTFNNLRVENQLIVPNGYIQSGGTSDLRIRSTASSITLWGDHIYATTDNTNKVDLTNAQVTDNLVTSIDNTSSDTKYPSAKCVYDNLETKADKSQTHALKAYSDNGEYLYDAEGLSDVKNYAHSTFDRSKFTVVGSPNITDDGIASGFQNGTNYLRTSVKTTDLLNKSWEIIAKFRPADVISPNALILFKLSNPSSIAGAEGWSSMGFNANNNLLIFYYKTGDASESSSQLYKSINLASYKNEYVTATYKFNINTGVYTFNAYRQDGTLIGTQSYAAETTNKQLYYINTESSFIITIGTTYSGTAITNGSIDLKQFSITVDGVEVFSGNKTGVDTYTIDGNTITIPYTISITGSKIARASSRQDIATVATALGSANYYTLDEDNGNFTLPQGELYGLIGDKTLRDSYYNGVTYWELFSNRRLEQGGTCESGVEYTLPKPFADANYVLTIPYSSKTATSFIPSATGDFIAKGMGLL